MNSKDPNDPSPSDNPSDELIDAALRLGKLRAEVEKVAGKPLSEGQFGVGLPLRQQEEFWQRILDFETAPHMSLSRALMERRSFRPAPIQDLDTDAKLYRALWDLIHALASMRIFLTFTDHLGDRDLYLLLVDQVLPEETSIMPDGSEWTERIDMATFSPPGCTEPFDSYLAYYANEEARQHWASDFPETPLPPKATPPHNRDHLLPNPDQPPTA